MSKRTLAILLALNRIQYGLGMILTPERNAKVWVGGAAARRRPTKVARRWFTALAVADGIDIPVTALAGDEIPLASRAATTAIAIASTAIGAAYAASPE